MRQETFSKLPLMLAMMVIATGQVGVSIYLPALPEMSQQFADSPLDIQWLVTIYMVGLGAAQLVYGLWLTHWEDVLFLYLVRVYIL